MRVTAGGTMEINGTGSYGSSVDAIRKAFDANAERAKRIAKEDGGPQFEKDMAELPMDERNVAAQNSVIKTKDKMLGDLLDITA